MKTPILIFVFGVCGIQSSCAFDDIYSMEHGLLQLTLELPEVVTNNISTTESMIDTIQDRESPVGEYIWMFLFANLYEIPKMKEYDDLSNIFGMVKNIIAPELQSNISLLNTHISAVRKQFKLFFEYMKQGNKIPVQTLKTFAENNIGPIEDHLNSLQIAMFPTEQEGNVNPGLISTIARASETFRDTYCIEASMMYYALSHLFRAIRITEITGAAVLIYSSLIHYAKDDEWRTKISNVTNNFEDRRSIYIKGINSAMTTAPLYVRACDPPNGAWIRDTTYFEMEKFEQLSIFQYKTVVRSKDCANAVEKSLFTYDSELDRCSGKLSDCKYSEVLDVCRLKNDTKRYEWIKSDENSYGMNFDKCPNGEKTSYAGWSNLWTGHCMCNCREADKNWISLSPVMTNKTENMVVIGLRFVRKNGVLYIQVKEGKLLTHGWIDPSSQRWIPLPEKPKLAVINATNNKFYLDDIQVLPDHTIIGIAFEETDGFAIKLTECEMGDRSGELIWDKCVETAIVHTKSSSTYLPLPRQNSIYTHRPHKPDSDDNWIRLQLSDWKHDAGQSTVPLFDGVAVETIPPLPLGGVGIFHKGVDNYAGFISLRLFPRRYKFFNNIL